jgi:hypothetical protein
MRNAHPESGRCSPRFVPPALAMKGGAHAASQHRASESSVRSYELGDDHADAHGVDEQRRTEHSLARDPEVPQDLASRRLEAASRRRSARARSACLAARRARRHRRKARWRERRGVFHRRRTDAASVARPLPERRWSRATVRALQTVGPGARASPAREARRPARDVRRMALREALGQLRPAAALLLRVRCLRSARRCVPEHRAPSCPAGGLAGAGRAGARARTDAEQREAVACFRAAVAGEERRVARCFRDVGAKAGACDRSGMASPSTMPRPRSA